MADPNMSDFYKRIARIQKAHAKGYGFEASGTRGRSFYLRPAPPRRSFLGPFLFLIICGFLLKGAMYSQIGADVYNSRVSALMAGKGLDRAGGWVMKADPMTIFVGHRIDQMLLKLK